MWCRVQEWIAESDVKFMKCIGGCPGAEGILAACGDGQVLNILLDNPFPILLWQHQTAVQLSDLSASKGSLALVDRNHDLVVVDLNRNQVRRPQTSLASRATLLTISLQICSQDCQACVVQLSGKG
jgi:hypothetical protein